ncbi:hypothetical protein [Salinibacterium sp.]|uniref:hypothetical protein n=1 Tax=Salinibacterium sp. TaxID=1915057 RepID=UPI00286B0152|nr:hypothetical protein [Salinibacterium sp.]
MSRRTLALLVALPALACAIVGLTHPMRLTEASAEYWRNMHIALIPIFPLIGLAPWLIARRAGVWFGRAGAILGYGFATFYTALDILAGVAGGALVMAGDSEVTGAVFGIGRILANVGVVSLVAGCLVAGVAAFRTAGVAALPGALLATVGAVLVQPGHVYLGLGTVAMVLFAGGFVAMAFAVTRPAPAAAQPA